MRAAAAATAIFALAVLRAAGAPLDAYDWAIPPGFPAPVVPADNPLTASRIELGRRLFYDKRLSGNGTQSCGTCHEQARAFTDGKARSIGSTGEVHPRGSMSLVNVAYARVLTWANPNQQRLEDQALVPMYGDHPVELGLNRDDAWVSRLSDDPLYIRLFTESFGPGGITRENAVKAIASFERTIVSARSPYDRYHFGRDDAAVSDAAKRGEVLFHSRPLSCFTCHGGVHFSDSMGQPRAGLAVSFHNTGLYNLPGPVSYPPQNRGLYDVSGDSRDVGKFKAPTLRNVAVTAPYMHDGSAATLEEVIDHYAAGGRTIAGGPFAGVGHDNPNKSDTIRGFALTHEQRSDLIAFLNTLTDDALLHDPSLADPWTAGK